MPGYKKTAFDPESSLFTLAPVRMIILACGIAASCSAAFIAINTPLAWSPDAAGFNEALMFFRVPCGILAVGLALIGLCGANHRSEQTRKQILRSAEQLALSTRHIALTEGQNRFAN
jgi:hypothetical protein